MAGGWSPAKVARVKSVTLPDKIKCAGCNEERTITAFSASQINRLRKKFATQGHLALVRNAVRCLYCTGGIMPTEIECYRCRITKPLDAFTKTQRLDWSSATCKTCTAYYMTSETWEEERENAIAMGIDGYTETGSTIDESVDGGVPLESLRSFSISTESPRLGHLQLEEDRQLGTGIWVEDASTNEADDDEVASTSQAPSSAARFSGWDLPAVRADERRPAPTSSTESKRKNWAKVKSADPSRAARILKMSDPMRHLNEKADREREELSCRSMVGARDHTKLHKEIRAGDVSTTDGDDASTVKAA
ncbi:uncharacterized protein BHQ10_003698 [Talaromyces amestolkiae]|uniref:Stc1 domain-containing protein n=1 Tax=Talaromyces amestolkiae TaxID=1196081 RepID=A0A364KVV4_TALAM|nr:uncharacterized protein BHQ10_003698 [Talaromyces amestolkiae]RAO67686.1 hypothetical protein BHQ10_003698 [Talaromyces amestolkiae]